MAWLGKAQGTRLKAKSEKRKYAPEYCLYTFVNTPKSGTQSKELMVNSGTQWGRRKPRLQVPLDFFSEW